MERLTKPAKNQVTKSKQRKKAPTVIEKQIAEELKIEFEKNSKKNPEVAYNHLSSHECANLKEIIANEIDEFKLKVCSVS